VQCIYRIIKNPDNPYVMVDRGFVNNPNLSWKAKGILLYLLSKPDDWKVYEDDIIKRATDGRDGVRSGIHELEKAGHLFRYYERDEKGRITGSKCDVYEISTENGFSVTGQTDTGQPDTTNNEYTNNESNNIYPAFAATVLNKYPGTKSKSVRDQKLPSILKKYGVEHIERCLDRYIAEVKDRDKKYILHESTFWNTRYKDYLDENYVENKPAKPKRLKTL
jgi:hypothetical protein